MDVHMRYQVNSPSIISEVLDGEGVMINLDTGTYYSAGGTAGAVWTLLDAGADAAEIAAWLQQAWGAQPGLAADVQAFIAQALEQKLIVPAPGRAAGPLPSAAPRADYMKPALEVFQDMQDLLLADPIHDVGAGGWPRRPGAEPR